MSKVEQIESSIERLGLSRRELAQVRDWLDDMLEDEMEFTPQFEAKISASEEAMRVGEPSRIVKK